MGPMYIWGEIIAARLVTTCGKNSRVRRTSEFPIRHVQALYIIRTGLRWETRTTGHFAIDFISSIELYRQLPQAAESRDIVRETDNKGQTSGG